MGNKHSKCVISTNTTSDSAPKKESVKLIDENGDTVLVESEPIPQSQNETIESNGACKATNEGQISQEDTDQPQSVKKKNPLNWIQKKISFKKLKTPKKSSQASAVESVQPTNNEISPVLPDLPTDEKLNSTINVPVVNQTITVSPQKENKKDAFIKGDQEIDHSESIRPEPIVDVSPYTNGYHNTNKELNENDTLEMICKPNECNNINAPTNTALSDKLASLRLDSSDPQPTSNGHDMTTNGYDVPTNGHDSQINGHNFSINGTESGFDCGAD